MDTTARSARSITYSYRGLALAFAALPLFAFATAAPARADFCIQLNGGSFSGDIGFFRFIGKLPKTPGQIAPLNGRAAGLDPVYGTATVATDGSYVELGATFFIDADEGQMDVTFFPPKSKKGSGYADYGQYGTGQDVNAKIVRCDLEPDRKMKPRSPRWRRY
jgi:hypothetical protein